MTPVTNFRIISTEHYTTSTRIAFGFTKPADACGYVLYKSTTGVTYDIASIKNDKSMGRSIDVSTEDTNGETIFIYTLDTTNYHGVEFYFKIVAADRYSNFSIDSSLLSVVTPCASPTNFLAAFDNYAVDLSWNSVTNPAFVNYYVERNTIRALTDLSLVDTTMYHDDLVVDTYVVVYDNTTYSQYSGKVSIAGQFELLSNKDVHRSDVTNNISAIYNLECYVANTVDSSWYVTSTGIIDSAYIPATKYIYSISAKNTNGDDSPISYTYINTKPLSTVYPIVRNPDNSQNTTIADTIWKTLKYALVGNIFYKKDVWSIPFFKDKLYNINGTCNISECNVDVFLNDIYTFTTSTGAYGEFNINYAFPKGTTKVTIQIRDKNNIQFSQISQPIYIKTLYMYTWFSILSEQFLKAFGDIDYVIRGINISGTTTQQFVDNYQPLIELYKDGPEDDTTFKLLSAEVFNSFEYVGYDDSLIKILEAFKTYVTDIDKYAVFYNNSLNTSHIIPYTYVASEVNLDRNVYSYLISTLHTSTGGTEETAGYMYELDNRYVPINNKYYVVLNWDDMPNATGYRIYRKEKYIITSTGYVESSTGYVHIVDAPISIFADNGTLTPANMYSPKLYNFSYLDEPTSMQHIINLNTAYYDNVELKKTHYTNIIIYMKDNTWLSELNFNRILFYINKMLPPEENYTITVCNNTESHIYNAQGTQL